MTDDLPALPSLQPGRYRHYKGGEYEVLGVVRHSETLEPLVLYRPLYNQTGAWVRPFAMFLETVEHQGRRQPRFSLVDAGGRGSLIRHGVQRSRNRLARRVADRR